MIQRLQASLTNLGTATAHPLAFGVVLAYAAVWLITSPQTLEWHGVASLATWFMTLLIQRAEHRDTQAIHAKLDELLQAEHRARNDLIKLDEKEPEEIEKHRDREKAQLGVSRA